MDDCLRDRGNARAQGIHLVSGYQRLYDCKGSHDHGISFIYSTNKVVIQYKPNNNLVYRPNMYTDGTVKRYTFSKH